MRAVMFPCFLALAQFALVILANPLILSPKGTTTLATHSSQARHNNGQDTSYKRTSPRQFTRAKLGLSGLEYDAVPPSTLTSRSTVSCKGPTGRSIKVTFQRPIAGNTVLFLITEAINVIQDHIRHVGDELVHQSPSFTWIQNNIQLHMWSSARYPSHYSDLLDTLVCLWASMQGNAYGAALYIFYDGEQEVGRGSIG